MDGLFGIDIHHGAADEWLIELVRTDLGLTQAAGHCEPANVVAVISSAIATVLPECERDRWTSADLVELAMMRKKLTSA